VTYSPDGRYAVNSDIVDESAVVPELRKLLKPDPDTLVILRVDRSATYATLTDLIAKCKSAGAISVSIGTEQTKVN
jgi:biopolymer transport protein ExbD